jgi:hypothetical protein
MGLRDEQTAATEGLLLLVVPPTRPEAAAVSVSSKSLRVVPERAPVAMDASAPSPFFEAEGASWDDGAIIAAAVAGAGVAAAVVPSACVHFVS